MFCATNKCDYDFKEWCFLLKQMVTQKKCVTNKNVISGRDYKGGLLLWFCHDEFSQFFEKRFEKKTWTNVFALEKFSTADIFSVDRPF
jgi:hypothetical protein